MKQIPSIKRGDTFYYIAQWNNAILSQLKSQVVDYSGKIIADCLIEQMASGIFKISVADTSDFPVGNTLYTDIQQTIDGFVQSSETMYFTVEMDVTQ